MPVDLSKTLVIGISSTALFDLSESDQIFQKRYKEDPQAAVTEYREYSRNHENEPLSDGTGMPIVKALLALNRHNKDDVTRPLIEVVVMSRNSPLTGIRVLNEIRRRELSITRSVFSGGSPVTGYLDAFDVDLFLTTRVTEAQQVIDDQTCAAALVKDPPSERITLRDDQVRIAFDGDGVLFDERSEIVYRTHGLDGFQRAEDHQRDIPMEKGPYAVLLEKISQVQKRLPFGVEFSPIRIAIVTARNAPAELRVINTLRAWGVYVNEIFFLGGVEKTKVLKAFGAHIYFDDQDLHLNLAARHVPACRVPYRSSSPMLQLTKEIKSWQGDIGEIASGPSSSLAVEIAPEIGATAIQVETKSIPNAANTEQTPPKAA